MVVSCALANSTNQDEACKAPDDDLDLYEFLDQNQAAALQTVDRFTEETSDNLFKYLTKNIKKCNYLDSDQNQFLIEKNNSLVLLHLNIRSLHKNYDSLYEFLIELNVLPDIICLTETRLKSQPLVNIDIPNYSFVHVNSDSFAGGVAVYLSNKLQYLLCPTQYQLYNSESLWLSILNGSSIKFTVGVVYRHSNLTNVDEFMQNFSNCLTDLSHSKHTYYVLGDFNIDTHPVNRTNYANNFINLLLSHGALPIITKPTRVTESSSTIIDHIITNDIAHILQPTVIKTEITDHYPILCAAQNFQHKGKTKLPNIYYRDKSKFNAEKFCEDLDFNLNNFFSNQPALNKENYNLLINHFTRIILSTINTHAPLKPLPRKQKKIQSKPWITKGILISIRKKNSMFVSHYLNGDLNHKSFFKKYLNKLTKIKALSKKLYFTTKLKENQNDPHRMWNVIRSALPTCSNRATSTTPTLNINGDITTDSQKIADHFNDFFL